MTEDRMNIFQRYKMEAVYLFLFILTVLFIFVNNGYTYFWFDEGFSMSIIKYSYLQIWDMTAADVHPPLYYFLLKAYGAIMGTSTLSLRAFSAIPILLTVIVSCIFIRRLWGDKVAISFIIMLLLSHYTYYMTSDIRMYSWSMFFVLMTFLCAYASYIYDSKKYLCLFVLFSIASAYSHYYALLTVGYIYFLYFIVTLLKDKKKVLPIVIAGFVFLLAYAPWLSIMISQVKSVTEDFWLEDFNVLKRFIQAVFVFSSFKGTYLIHYYKGIVEWGVYALLLLFLFANLVKNGKKRDVLEVILIFSVFLVPLLVGLLYSAYVKPVFVIRYTCCFVGVYFFALAKLVSYVDFSKKINVILSSLFLCFFLVLSWGALSHQLHLRKLNSDGLTVITDFVDQNRDENTAFLYRDSIFSSMAIYPNIYPDNVHIAKRDTLAIKERAVANVLGAQYVDSYASIDTMYKQIYVLGYYYLAANEKNIMYNKEDSLELDKYFEIVRKSNTNSRFEVFELRRRED